MDASKLHYNMIVAVTAAVTASCVFFNLLLFQRNGLYFAGVVNRQSQLACLNLAAAITE
jgi:hypothetical protein